MLLVLLRQVYTIVSLERVLTVVIVREVFYKHNTETYVLSCVVSKQILILLMIEKELLPEKCI